MLHQRLLFGSLMIAALVGLFWLDRWIQHGPAGAAWFLGASDYAFAGVVISAVWAIVVAFATLELARLLRGAGYEPVTNWAVFCNVALALSPLITASVTRMPSDSNVLWMLLLAAAGSAWAVASRRRVEGAARDVALTLLMIVYLGVLGSYIPRLAVQGGNAWRLLYLLLVIKSSDIGAYFTGMAIGRHKLIVWLSPKKTWEGFWGGVALAAVVAAVGSAVTGFEVRSFGGAPPGAWVNAAVMGAMLGVLGQAGDLFESLLKRDLKVKDSGSVVPAFGGLLDLLDSPLVCVPVGYWMMLY